MISELLERAGNDLLRFDPDTAGRLSRLQGKVFKLHVLGLDRVLYFVPGESGVMVRDRWPAQADITLTGPPLSFAQFALRQRQPDNRLFTERKLVIEGDAELAQDFQRILAGLDVDLEEWLSRYVGDVAAHQVGRGVGALRRWATEAAESLRLDVREFLVEEARILTTDWRVAEFVEGTDTLRADVERLEQRVRRLRSQLD